MHGLCVTDYYRKISSSGRNTRPRVPAAARKPVLWSGVIKVKTRCFLHMAKAVAAKMFAAVPAGDNNQLAHSLAPVQHTQDHHPSAAFPIIRLQRHSIEQDTPAVMSRFGIFLVPLQIAERRINLCPICNCAAGNRIFRAAVTEDYPQFPHNHALGTRVRAACLFITLPQRLSPQRSDPHCADGCQRTDCLHRECA